jgi:hypothetical protein
MFPKEFKNDAVWSISTHQGIKVFSDWNNLTIIKYIVKHGVAKFLDFDDGASFPNYTDKRISGRPQIAHAVSCCAFTQDSNSFYLFPIHKRELEAVRLEGDDLIRYIKTLNDMKVGFKYKYFGEQPVGSIGGQWVKKADGNGTYPIPIYKGENNFHWIGVPKFVNKNEDGTVTNGWMAQPYLHWIFLRYLLNVQTGQWASYKDDRHLVTTNAFGDVINYQTKAYYNIPRLMMYLIDELHMDPFRAMMYTQAAGPWNSGWGMTFSDFGSVKHKSYHPHVGLTKDQFKQLWAARSYQGTMNGTFCGLNTQGNVATANGWNLEAKHNPDESSKLFYAGQIKEFVEYLDGCYGLKSLKAKKATVNGTKAIRKAVVKRKAPVNK